MQSIHFFILKSDLDRCRGFLSDICLLMFYYFKTNTAHKKIKSTKYYSFQFKETGCLIHFYVDNIMVWENISVFFKHFRILHLNFRCLEFFLRWKALKRQTSCMKKISKTFVIIHSYFNCLFEATRDKRRLLTFCSVVSEFKLFVK